MSKHYYIYMLECSNAAYYTGYTTDIVRRYQEHCAGSLKCKYTRSFPPKRLAACWQVETSLAVAMRIESALKKLKRHEKQQVIHSPQSLETTIGLEQEGITMLVVNHATLSLDSSLNFG